MLKTNKSSEEKYILIIEDDPDQQSLLSSFAHDEVKRIFSDENINDAQRSKAKSIRIISATNIKALEQATRSHKNILLAILDCNIPDTKDSEPHDQFIKTAYKITGQHKTVDIVNKQLPGTPITMISSMNRFKIIVTQYYQNTHNLSINFINKKDAQMIKKNIGYYIRQYIK